MYYLMKNVYRLLSTLTLLITLSTAYAQKITMELIKYSNNSSLPTYTAPIPVTSAQYSFSQTLNLSSQSSGTGAGKATFLPMVITKQVDGSTASLQTSLFTGAPYQYVRLSFYRADGTLAYRVVLGLVAVSNYSASGATGCTSGCPTLSETVNFEYGAVATYDPTANTIVRWSRITNTSNSNDIPDSVIKP